MEFLKPVKSFELPANDSFSIKKWLESADNRETSVPIHSLTGNGGMDWAELEEAAAAPTSVTEYTLKSSCKNRQVVRDLNDTSKLCMSFSQVLAFLALDHHVPSEAYHQFLFYVGNYKNRGPRWELRAGLHSKGGMVLHHKDPGGGWTLEIDYYFEHCGRYISQNIVAPS